MLLDIVLPVDSEDKCNKKIRNNMHNKACTETSYAFLNAIFYQLKELMFFNPRTFENYIVFTT